MGLEATIKLANSPEFIRAYDIHGLHYDGKPVSSDDQAFYDEYVTKLIEKAEEEGNAKVPYEDRTIGIGTLLWLAYAAKYVTQTS